MERYINIPTSRRTAKYSEISRVGNMCISSEVIMYSIKDVVEMTGWSKKIVQKLFNDPEFPSVDYGKAKMVECHALINYFSIRRERDQYMYWRQRDE